MRLDIRAAALAVGSVTALIYTFCTVFCVLVPESTLVYVTTLLFHIDVTGLFRHITWERFIISLLSWGLGMAIVAGATAWLYNLTAQTPVSNTQA